MHSLTAFGQDLEVAWADTRGLSNSALASSINTLRAAGGTDTSWPDMSMVCMSFDSLSSYR